MALKYMTMLLSNEQFNNSNHLALIGEATAASVTVDEDDITNGLVFPALAGTIDMTAVSTTTDITIIIEKISGADRNNLVNVIYKTA